MTKTVRELLGIDSDVVVSMVSSDSRNIKENGLFFCLKGLTVDGHNFIDKAIANGAKTIIHEDEVEKKEGIVYFKTNDMINTINDLSAKFFDYPSKELVMIGVTGTNGKSTTTTVLKELLSQSTKAGNIGTIAIAYGDVIKPSPYTTPEPYQLHGFLKEMVDYGCSHVAMEVSSHGLIQGRVNNIDYKYAVMTNLTHEHLDFHHTLQEYLEAKAILFKRLNKDQFAILNCDDKFSYEYLKNNTQAKVITYGQDEMADCRISNVKLAANHSSFDMTYLNQTYHIETNLVALFNVYNLTAALLIVLLEGQDIDQAINKCASLSQVDGRMEVVNMGQPFNVIVDYAHTPDGFSKVYEYVKSINKGKVISIFASAGERDHPKRPILGQIARDNSDLIIYTTEDPRSESPLAIALEIAGGKFNEKEIYRQDRISAILYAFTLAKKDDTIVILGKGNEPYQVMSYKKVPYLGDLTIAKLIIERGLHMKLNKYIDHTMLKQDASFESIKTLCLEAKEHDFASVCVNPVWVKASAEMLEGTSVKVCTVIGFPLGAQTTATKAFETADAVKNGATEIDMVVNVAKVKELDEEYTYNDIKAVVDAAAGNVVKVIFETCLLTDEQKIFACKMSEKAGANFVKTSTGFSTGGATIADVKLMKANINANMEVKASGGVRTPQEFEAMIEAGATRIGTSSGVNLINGKNSTTNY